MTANDAYEILTRNNALVRVRCCLDFDSFFAFCLAPIYVRDDDEYLSGTILQAVDKKSGKVFDYDITSDIDAYEKAIETKVNTFFDRII
jgi:hypothetical protein